MDLHSIEVAPLAGLVAAPGLAAVAPGAVDADVVAGRHGEAVDHVEAYRIEVVPKARQDMEQRRQQVGAAVKAADESAVAKPVGENVCACVRLPPKNRAAVSAVVRISASPNRPCPSPYSASLISTAVAY